MPSDKPYSAFGRDGRMQDPPIKPPSVPDVPAETTEPIKTTGGDDELRTAIEELTQAIRDLTDRQREQQSDGNREDRRDDSSSYESLAASIRELGNKQDEQATVLGQLNNHLSLLAMKRESPQDNGSQFI